LVTTTKSPADMPRLLVVLMVLICSSVIAQDFPTVNIRLSQARFPAFALELKKQANLDVFYRPVEVDSVIVTLDGSAQPLNTILDQLFADTQLRYSLFGSSLYIMRGRELLTTLPVDFYGLTPATQPATTFDFSDYQTRDKNKEDDLKLHIVGTKTSNMQGEAQLTGLITDAKTGEAIVGASVYIEKTTTGVATDPFGRYTLTLPKGRHELKIKSIGMKIATRNVMLYGNGKLDVEIVEDITPLKEVVVEAERDARVTGMEMGMEKLDIKVMKQMPLILGETDVMKVMLALPGVQSVGEGTNGLNVRGGTASQNLILFNDAVVYNPSHVFGFFSTFNPDVLKNVELYKSGITADYGGRLSSVMDISAREGNLKKFSGSGGLSPVTGRLMFEGPILKDKASFLIGVRSTYSDWLMKQLSSARLQQSQASFYDITGNVTYKINDNNNLSINGYWSHDNFSIASDTAYQYGDRNASIKWKHIFNPQLFGTFTGSYSRYNYDVDSDINPIDAFKMGFDIGQVNAKADFTYLFSSRHTFTAGVSSIFYKLAPGDLEPDGEESLVVPIHLQKEQATENALYFGDNFEISPKTSLYAGVRYSFYNSLGPKDVYLYQEGQPLSGNTLIDTVHYGAGKSTARYSGFEPRVSLRYILTNSSSVKVSFNRLRQYIQMLSNTVTIAPTDIWKLSDQYIKPQVGNQISAGIYKNLKGNMIETSAEVYYKTLESTIDFKNGALLLLNHHLETDVIEARGKAYGVELMIKKSVGRLNGWISYTWSRSFLQTKGLFDSETVNNGEYYPSNYDKPHAVNFIGNYKFSRRINFSLNTVYSTGRPITVPVAKYEIGGVSRVYYSERNQYRIPDYFRIDASLNLEGNHKIKKLAHSSWTLAVYNLTGRNNAYSVFFTSQDGVIKGYKMSVFAQAIPTLTFNFKF
jgi:hypothetical protein